MEIKILEEAGFEWAMEGLARSFNQNIEKMPAVALNLSSKDMGHNKFLESIVVWIRITAPRFWWSEFDTYRVGITKQSNSTMHTLKKQLLTSENFEYPIDEKYISYLNHLITCNEPIDIIKNALPDGFIQGRTVCTNYKVLRNIILQRRNHKLPQWKFFCEEMKKLRWPEALGIEGWHLAEVI